MLLPRLALRCRRGDPRNPGRAGDEHLEAAALPRRLPYPRAQRDRVRVHGTAGGAARLSPLR